ncbi:Dps family protein [Bacteroidota bacterium]
MYDDLAEKAEEVAERILMREEKPVHTFSEYLKLSNIKESKVKSSTQETVNEILDGLKVLLELERKIIKMAADRGDEASVDLLTP